MLRLNNMETKSEMKEGAKRGPKMYCFGNF